MAVRREVVRLELDDQFTAGAARAAASAALLKREVDGLNGVSTRSGAIEKVSKDVDSLSKSAVSGSKEIDRYSGRLRLLTDAALILGPAAVVVGAGLGGMAVSAGVAGLALYGLGDSLKALNEYQLDPTAANLEKLNQEMAKAGPAGRDFVAYLDSLGPKLSDLQQVARAGFLPGLQDGIESLMTRFPEMRQIIGDLATEMGDLAAKGGEWLAGPGFEKFEAFLEYARSVGPEVGDFILSLASALAGIAQAAAPVGAVTLPILTRLLDVIAAIANSPLGPALMGTATAFAVVSRSTALVEGALSKLSGTSLTAATNLAAIGKGLEFGGALIAINQLDAAFDKLMNTRVDQSALSRNLEALAGGDAFKGNLGQIADDIEKVNAALLTGADKVLGKIPGDPVGMDDARDNIKAVDDALAHMVESGDTDMAAAAFDRFYDAARKAGVSTADIRKQFPQYATAVENAGEATENYGNSMADATAPTKTFAQQVEEATQAMQDQRSAALGAFDAVTQYGQALDAAQDAAAKGKRGINANTQAGRENRQALSQLAAAWNNQSDAVRNNSDKFRKARSDFIATATAMGVPEAAARRLARQLLNLPDSKVIKVSAETQQARSALAEIIREAQSVPRTIRTDYIVNQVNRISKIDAGSAGTQVGNHGTYAGGGRLPADGRPYGDRVPILAAPTEYIVSNRYGQVDRNLALLEAINSGGFSRDAYRLAAGGAVADSFAGPLPTLKELTA